MSPPVCLIIFRRPEHTRRVSEAIAKARPSKLLVFADGPRPDHPEDWAACAAARDMIDRIDWDCEVLKNYSDVNLGCGSGPVSAIDWAFSHVEESIILEDDCLPDPSFFRFSDELLDKYRDDERVMHINGCTYRRGNLRIPESYYFCQDIGCWGWATWRRAWLHFDIAVKAWRLLRKTNFLHDVIDSDFFADHYGHALEAAFTSGGDVNYWDYQWAFACWVNNGLGIYPRLNLVTNLGCGPDATHTVDPDSPVAHLSTRSMRFPLIHPEIVFPNREIDRQGWSNHIPGIEVPSTAVRLRRKVSSVTPPLIRKIVRQCRSYLG